MRKIDFVTATMFFVFAFLSIHDQASAAVAGIWDVSGTMKEVVKVGGKSVVFKTHEGDVYTFNSDGAFSAEDLTGTWKQKKKNFSVTIDMTAFQALCSATEEALKDQYNIAVDITPGSISLSGTESGKNRITGVFNIKLSMYYPANRKTGTMTMQYTFTGKKTSGGSAVYKRPLSEEFYKQSGLLADRLAEAIAEEFNDDDIE